MTRDSELVVLLSTELLTQYVSEGIRLSCEILGIKFNLLYVNQSISVGGLCILIPSQNDFNSDFAVAIQTIPTYNFS